MSNPFNFINRRGFLKGSLVGILMSTPLSKAMAAVPITAKLIGQPTSSSFSVAISATSTVRVYIEYGYSKSSVVGKTPFINIAKGSNQTLIVSMNKQ